MFRPVYLSTQARASDIFSAWDAPRQGQDPRFPQKPESCVPAAGWGGPALLRCGPAADQML